MVAMVCEDISRLDDSCSFEKENTCLAANPFELCQVKEGKKEDEEFIKIEKDESSLGKQTVASRQILKAGEKIRELEFELKKVANALKRAESENVELKHELYLTNHRFEETGKTHAELEHHHKKLQEKLAEAEENFSKV
ncbi:hypothetical protein Droror1_Dr00027479 [Drosera rotundifolia]